MPITHFPVWHCPLKHFPARHFPGGGSGFYRVYRGVGGITNVNWSAPVAEVNPEVTSPTLSGLGHAASTRYTYVVRPVRGGDELETPDLSCAVEFETDAAGDWMGARPAPVEQLSAEVMADGRIRLTWHYRTPYGMTAPHDFGVYHAPSADITPGSPQATVTYQADGRYTTTLNLTDGQTYYFAVTARTTAGVESRLSPVVGPFVADATAPTAPTVYVAPSF